MKFPLFIAIHFLSILNIGIIISSGSGIENEMYINFISLFMLYLIINSIYLYMISTSTKDSVKKQAYSIMPMVILNIALHSTHFQSFVYLLLAYNIFLIALKYKKSKRINALDIILNIGVLGLYYLNNLSYVPLSIASVFYNTYRNYGYKYRRKISLLPIVEKQEKYIVLAVIALSVILILILNPSTLVFQMVLHIIFFIFEIIIILNISNRGVYYREGRELNFISQYVSKERNAFSAVLHDEIIQDLTSVYNLLSVREPDVNYVREIISKLEAKSRAIMNFYGENTFEELSLYENIEHIIASVRPIYPNSEMEIELYISDGIEFKNDIMGDVLSIAKELINNAYKHSKGTLLKLSIEMQGGVMTILSVNDGVELEGYERALNSKGGLFIIEDILLDYGGSMEIEYDSGRISILCVLGGSEDEDTII